MREGCLTVGPNKRFAECVLCVCVRERERERERKKSKENEREKEKERASVYSAWVHRA